MTDRPILFSGPMVRANRDGRKTMTRRILTPQPEHLQVYDWKGKRLHDSEYRHWCYKGHVGDDNFQNITTQLMDALPYQVGDRLWSREAWQAWAEFDPLPPRDIPAGADVLYIADRENSRWESRYRHARFMPRCFSRMTHIVEAVKVERVKDITNADAIAEGIIDHRQSVIGGHGAGGLHHEIMANGFHHLEELDCDGSGEDDPTFESPQEAFADLWMSVNGEDAWERNDWVVAATYQTVFQNIDLIGDNHE